MPSYIDENHIADYARQAWREKQDDRDFCACCDSLLIEGIDDSGEFVVCEKCKGKGFKICPESLEVVSGDQCKDCERGCR